MSALPQRATRPMTTTPLAGRALSSPSEGNRGSHRIQEATPKANPTAKRISPVDRSLPHLTPAEVADFTTQLAVMTRTGLDIATALQCLCRLAATRRSRRLYERLMEDVNAGKSISEALSSHEKVFGPTYVATLAAGESSGSLPKVLDQLAGLLRNEVRLQTKIRSLLVYPLMLTGVSTLVVSGLMLLVLPQFAQIFEQQGTPLPMLTRSMLAVATSITNSARIARSNTKSKI